MEKGHFLKLSLDCIIVMITLYALSFFLTDLLMTVEDTNAVKAVLLGIFSFLGFFVVICMIAVDGRYYRPVVFLITTEAVIVAKFFHFISPDIMKIEYFFIATFFIGVLFSEILGRFEKGSTGFLFGSIAFLSPLFSFLAVWKNNPIFIFLGVVLYGTVIAYVMLPAIKYPLEVKLKEKIKESLVLQEDFTP